VAICSAGLPVSTTQTITGALIAIGLTEGLKGVNWRAVLKVRTPSCPSHIHTPGVVGVRLSGPVMPTQKLDGQKFLLALKRQPATRLWLHLCMRRKATSVPTFERC
jgi:hypothetical protein